MQSCTKFSIFLALGLFYLSLGQEGVDVKLMLAKGDHKKTDGVKGVRKCGGPGEFVQFRVDGCDKSDTCRLKANGEKLHAEIDFVPIINMERLKFKITAFLNGNPLVMHDAAIKNSNVKKGTKYTIHMRAEGNPAMSGQTVRGRYEVINDVDQSLRLCVDVDIEWERDNLVQGIGKAING